jgi:tetratricopeptide (TPR) repeat protein
MALANIGRIDDAITSFDEAIKINPQDPIAWNNKGVILRDQGNYREALSCFNKALEIDPSYEVAKTNKQLTMQDQTAQNPDNFYELDDMLYRAKQREGSLMN